MLTSGGNDGTRVVVAIALSLCGVLLLLLLLLLLIVSNTKQVIHFDLNHTTDYHIKKHGDNIIAPEGKIVGEKSLQDIGPGRSQISLTLMELDFTLNVEFKFKMVDEQKEEEVG